MKTKLIDTNIIVRYLVEDNKNKKYRKIFELFERIEAKEEIVFIDIVVILETYFVLTKVYKIPVPKVIESLKDIISFSGVEMDNKNIVISALNRILHKKTDFADAFLIELSLIKNTTIYTIDYDLIKSEAKTINLITDSHG